MVGDRGGERCCTIEELSSDFGGGQATLFIPHTMREKCVIESCIWFRDGRMRVGEREKERDRTEEPD